MNLADLRREYTQNGLKETDLDPNPLKQFGVWFDAVLTAKLLEPTAMTLATVDSEGRPSARIVLLKGVDERGFVFFTNYHSRKGDELAQNPHAAIVLHWPEFERQIRIEGVTERVAREASIAYFQSRPYKSQLGALVSEQSKVVPSREFLEQRMAELEAKYRQGQVPVPEHWGGYRLVPTAMEFWQGRQSRLHDRLLYTIQPSGEWKIERLAP